MARTEGQWKKGIGLITPSEDVPILLRNDYLNFGQDVGAIGYGIRDNAGTLEFKNEAGDWVAFGSGGGGGPVAASDVTVDDTNFEVLSATDAQTAFEKSDQFFLDARSTGVKGGGELTDLGLGVIRIAEGQGNILNNTNPLTPANDKITWAQTDIDLSGQPDGVQNFIFVNSAGTVTFTTTEPSHAEYRTTLPLWRVVIRGGEVSGFVSIVQPLQQYGPQIWDIWRALGLRKDAKTLLLSGDGAGGVDISAGEIYAPGANFYNVGGALNPADVEFDAQPTATFRLVNQNNVQSADLTTFDVTNYDNAGTNTAMTNNKWGIYSLYMFTNGNVRVLRPQAQYNTLIEASEALRFAGFSPIIPANLNDAFPLGWIIFQKGDTNLTTADFVTSNPDGGIGGAISTIGVGYLAAANNLSDVENITTARNNLGLGTAAVANTGTSAGNVPVLDGAGKLNNSVIPNLSISEFLGDFTDLTAALADAGVQASQRGDWFTIQTGGGETYIVIADSPTIAGDVKQLSTPTDAVTSVNSKTGAVILDADDIDDTGTTHKFVTDAQRTKIDSVETNADVTDAANVEDTITSVSATSLTDASVIPFVVSAALRKITWANMKSAIATYYNSVTATMTNKTLTDAKIIGAINAQTGTTYTLVLADASTTVTMSNASANTLTVPPNSSVAFAVGTRLMVQQKGAGATTIAAGAGVTINAPTTVTLAIGEQYESRGLLKTATDTWELI